MTSSYGVIIAREHGDNDATICNPQATLGPIVQLGLARASGCIWWTVTRLLVKKRGSISQLAKDESGDCRTTSLTEQHAL